MTEAFLLSFGECMLELSGSLTLNSNTYLSYGGDTLNTAYYCSQIQGKAYYLSALGNDPLSLSMVESWKNHNIGTEFVFHIENTFPGLYAIKVDPNGEREFLYWREQAPIRQLLSHITPKQVVDLINKVGKTPWLYLSGITLSLFQNDLDALERLIQAICKLNGKIIFDINYRPNGWKNNTQLAQEIINRFLPYVTIALPTFDDESLLWGDSSPEDTIARYASANVRTVVIKRGLEPSYLYHQKQTTPIPLTIKQSKPVDTTAAGDSFNGGFIAALLKNKSMETAVQWGQAVSAEVVMHKGAIIDKAYIQKVISSL